MGTWAIQEDKIPAVIREIKDLKKRVYSIAGDDSLFDHLQRAINRLEELSKAGDVEGKDKEEKEAKFRELMRDYSETGEKMYAMAKELGHVDKEAEELRTELEVLLGSEFWVFQTDAIRHPFREDYIVHIERKIPIEKETGKPEPLPESIPLF